MNNKFLSKKVSGDMSLIMITIVIFVLGIICLRYWMDSKMIISYACAHTEIGNGKKVTTGFLSYFHNNGECIIDYGEGRVYTEWGIDSCYDGEPVIREVRDYTCD